MVLLAKATHHLLCDEGKKNRRTSRTRECRFNLWRKKIKKLEYLWWREMNSCYTECPPSDGWRARTVKKKVRQVCKSTKGKDVKLELVENDAITCIAMHTQERLLCPMASLQSCSLREWTEWENALMGWKRKIQTTVPDLFKTIKLFVFLCLCLWLFFFFFLQRRRIGTTDKRWEMCSIAWWRAREKK